jgi:hypothetical protein
MNENLILYIGHADAALIWFQHDISTYKFVVTMVPPACTKRHMNLNAFNSIFFHLIVVLLCCRGSKYKKEECGEV